MRGIARAFFISALVYGLLGLLLGIHMAIGQDREQLPTHAHIMVVGWLSFAIFSFFYHFFGQAMPQLLASLHFWVAEASLIIIVAGLSLVFSGHTEFEPLAAVGAIGYAGSFAVFVLGAILALCVPSG
jgi:hypothetical protein